MRLLRRHDSSDFSLTQFDDGTIPHYVVPSYTWGAETEKVSFEESPNISGKNKPSYQRIRCCREQTGQHGLEPINILVLPAINTQHLPVAEERSIVHSTVTCSTAVSDKTSVSSNRSENYPAAGTELSSHYNSPSSTPHFWQDNTLQDVGDHLPTYAHEYCEPELLNNGPVTPGFKHSHLSADGRDDSGYGEQELPTLGKDTAHSEEGILANYESSALRDFMDDPGHQYWTWCKEQQNWWHKDENTNVRIWAPLDFD